MQSEASLVRRVSAPKVLRLLVVDDDFIQRIIISKIGQQAGYDVTVAGSFAEAANLLKTEMFGCVTLDLALGEDSGTQLLRTIAETGTPQVFVISGCEERVLNSTLRLSSALGLRCRTIAKPLDPQALRSAFDGNLPQVAGVRHQAGIVPAIDATQIATALDEGEIVPWFQPKVELATGRVMGCEALARWISPTLGAVPPDVFVPLAEGAGLMPQLTNRLLRASTVAMRRIVESNPGFSVAVNVSASLLSDLALADEIDAAIADSGFPAAALIVEVTESTAMSDIAKATDILVGLRVKGVGVSIDDFGTGYSSLAALARMPFSELKIDALFVRDMDADRDMARVVRACVHLGHDLGMKVVAEGIETKAGWKRLHDVGCDIGQGYVFAPALEASRLADWMEQWSGRVNPARK
jgi:EAL domain-containing protein (putative c-di-GMP-specific phosphodiesterase class I)